MSKNDFMGDLTDRQKDILACLFFRLSYKSIGRVLKISNRTVENHIREIFQKAEVSSKYEIIQILKQPGNALFMKDLEQCYNRITANNNLPSLNIRPYILMIIISLVVVFCFYHYQAPEQEEILNSVKNNVYLLDRATILNQIERNGKIVILEGQGGAGKTTLAREYLKNSKSPLKYEINAETLETMRSDIFVLLKNLVNTQRDTDELNAISSIATPEERDREISIFLYKQLRKQKSWCILFDNVDTFRVFGSLYLENVLRLDGKVIITTRNKNIQNYFSSSKIIHIGKLSAKEKVELFCKITQKKSAEVEEQLLEKIPSYPLDVSCCAYYIKNTGISLQSYIEKMQQMNRTFLNNNKKILADNVNYNESRESIITAVLDDIVEKIPNLTSALFLISVLDSQEIPLELLQYISKNDVIDDCIYQLQRYGLIDINSKNFISIHRVTQTFIRYYCLQKMSKDDVERSISKCLRIVQYAPSVNLINHIKAIISNLANKLPIQSKMQLQIRLVDLIQNYGSSPLDALEYIKEIEASGKDQINQYKMAELRITAANLCNGANRTREAMAFLRELDQLPFNELYATLFVEYRRLLGILYMKQRKISEANENFDMAIGILKRVNNNSEQNKIAEAAIYSAKGANHFLYYVNKPEMYEAIKLMHYAISLVENIKLEKAMMVLAETKIRLAGVYNGIKQYDNAIKMCDDTEDILKKVKTVCNEYYSIKGLISVERGHAFLRKNDLEKAKKYFFDARSIFERVMIQDYFYRSRMQEAEVLVRLGEYEQAYRNCKDVIQCNRRDNDYNELFLNTAYYNAGVIQYKLRNFSLSLKHFHDFSIGMKRFCKHFLKKVDYEKLQKMNAFEVISDENNIRQCLKNAYEIFRIVCLDGSEFITDYVHKNYLNSK